MTGSGDANGKNLAASTMEVLGHDNRTAGGALAIKTCTKM